MAEDTAEGLKDAIRVDTAELRGHVDAVVRSSVEETVNALLQAEADQVCKAGRYERSPERVDTRAGHYERQLETKAGAVVLKMAKLRSLPFETAIIEGKPCSCAPEWLGPVTHPPKATRAHSEIPPVFLDEHVGG